uniref:Reverse transcriptase n=1 Tax=Botryococcus braunii Showa TaxID=1202541 RepID=A0A171CYG0_BOTBR|nr:reverse transcriptase [Botryococcus braunii Showa]
MKSAQIHLLQMDSKDYVKKFKKAHAYIYYADDFVGLCETHEDALEAKQLLADQLDICYLQLLETKTWITEINDRFDFLGCTLRTCLGLGNIDCRRGVKRERFKTLITRSKHALKKYRGKLAEVFKK